MDASTANSSSAFSIGPASAARPSAAAMCASISPAVRYIMLSSVYSRAVISPSLCLIAPNVPIGTLNCLRVAAYFAASASDALAPPEAIAPSLNRPKLSTLNATLWPLPISPSTASAGILTSCSRTGVVDEPWSPILCSSLPDDTPGHAPFDDEGGERLAAPPWRRR